MEFLDDILNQNEAEEEAEEPRPKAQSESPPEPEGDPWENLVAGVTYEEPNMLPRDEPRQRRSKTGLRLSSTQMLILGALAFAVVVVWGLIVLTLARARSTAKPEPQNVSTAATSEAAVEATDPSAILSETSSEHDGTATPTADPNATPTPVPPVSTQYDLKIQENPENGALYVVRGREYLSVGAYEAALADFQKAQALTSAERPEIYEGLGWAHFYLGDLTAAAEALEQAVALDETRQRAYFGLGKVYYYAGNYEAAAKAFDTAAEINPADAPAEAWLGISAAHLGDLQEAADAVGRAMQQTEEDLPIIYIARSWARRIQQPPDIDGTQGDLLYARELAPNAFLPLNALANFYLMHRPERLSEAEQLAVYANNWAASDVEHAIALQTLGRIYLEQGRHEDAYAVLSEAAEFVPVEGKLQLAGLTHDLERAQP